MSKLQIRPVSAVAQTAGANRVHWLTQEDNTQAPLLYERIASRSGFIPYCQRLN